MENTSFRQAGKEVYGKLYRGSVVDAYNRLTQPSIPSKSEKLLQTPSKNEGFGCSANRFTEKNVRIPGPGQYSEPSNDNPSMSKKGYGGLTNSAPRFKKYQYVNSIPGPGSYDEQPSTTQSFTIATGNTKSLKKIQDFPAPGQYNPLTPSSTKQLTYMFKSKSKRLEAPSKISPAPWQYTPSYTLIRSSSSALSSSFKLPVNVRRHQVNLYDPHSEIANGITPGPGDYIPETKNDANRPSSMFVITEKDRFGKSSKPKVHDLTPGPGQYVKPTIMGKSQVSGAVFMSESERKWFNTNKKPPGPAFYKPMYQPKKKSFHLKPNSVWV